MFSWNGAGVGESGNENFDAEEIVGRMGVTVKRADSDRGLVELEELFGAVTCEGGKRSPDGRVIEVRAAGRFAAARVDLGGGRGMSTRAERG